MTINTTAGQSGSGVKAPDLNLVIRATQAISGEVTLGVEQMLRKLLGIFVESSRAQKGFLILENEGAWIVTIAGVANPAAGSQATQELTRVEILTVPSVLLESFEELSLTVVHHIQKTGESLVINDATTDSRLAGDPYVTRYQPKSILCLPIVRRGKLVEIVYLENNLSPAAFTPDRVTVTQILAAQAAISLENARLHEATKQEMAERKQAEETLRAITEGTAGVTGRGFFRSLVRQMAMALQVRYAFVTECTDLTMTRVRTLALVENNEFQENIEYDLAGTPCEGVIGGSACYYPNGVERLFPVEVGKESYLGVPIYDSAGRILGHLAVFDAKPMARESPNISILQIFAARAGAELERKRAEEALRQAHDEMERRVAERTRELSAANEQLQQKIEEHRQTEQALRESEARYRRLLSRTQTNLAETEAHARQLSLLNELSQHISLAMSEDELFNVVAHYTPKIFQSDRASVALLTEATDHLEILVLEGDGDAIPAGTRLPMAGTALGQVVQEKRVLNMPTIAASDFLDFQMLARQGLRSGMIAPLVTGGQVIGTLNVADSSPNAFDRRDEHLILQIASLLASNVENHRRNRELRQAKEAAEEARQTAEAANRAKSEFLASMSHELRTPLNGILGYAQILKRDSSLTQAQKERVAIIQSSGDHLLTLINDVLDLSKIEAQKMELHLNDFYFPEFLDSIVEIGRVPAEQKSLSFIYESLSVLPAGVRGDEQRLRQVLLNLLGNATKFTEVGGIAFKVGYPAQRLSEIDHAEDYKIRFQIEDTGAGIAPEYLDEIFTPFHQVGEQRHLTEGTGLGLAISQKLVEIMGGKLQVESTPGHGTVFWFEVELPQVSDWVEAVKPDERNIMGFEGAKRKVLVVDDKWENRSVIVNLLAPLGFEIVEATDGRDSLAKTIEFQPDLVLMDLVMPVLDGFEAARQIKQLPPGPNITIIALSASAFDHTRQECLAAGCDDFIPKPVRAPELFEKLRIHLGLEWIYEPQGGGERWGQWQPGGPFAAASHTPPPPILAVSPPPGEVAVLLDLAMQGDVKALLEQVDKIEQMDDQFGPVAKEIRRLAKAFQIKQIREFIRFYIG